MNELNLSYVFQNFIWIPILSSLIGFLWNSSLQLFGNI